MNRREVARVGQWVFFVCFVGHGATAHGAPHPWPFDFDPELADDPAGIEQGLQELGQNLPGLRDEELTEVQLGPVSLYLFSGLVDALDRAVDSGPGLMPEVTRHAVLCAEHDAFVYPALLVPNPSGACVRAEQAIASAFEDNASSCLEVEFPETYVFDHPPGHVTTEVVSSFEGLIAVAGEALRHLDYPEGLLPQGFFATMRPIIAKLRYHTLVQQLDERLAAYGNAANELSGSSSCFEPGARTAFEDTLAALTAELEAARSSLDQLYREGLAAAAADRTAMLEQCRARLDLPQPALTDEERIILSFYIGGIYWRARGAGLLAYPPDPEQGLLRRALYVRYPYQLIGNLTGGLGEEGALGVGNNILFDENWGWDEWWDMGTTPGSADKYSDLVGMTKRGKRGTSRVRPQLERRGFDIRSLVAGGMQMGPCYYYAWELLRDFRLGDDLQDPYMWLIEWPTSIGEFCAGASLAEGLARTLLWGKEIPPDECEELCPGGSCSDAGVDGGLVDSGVDSGPDASTDASTDGTACGPCPDGHQCNGAGVCVPITGDGGLEPDSDGSQPNDAAPDTAITDGGDGGVPADSGCGCTTAAQGAPATALALLLLGVALFLRKKGGRSDG